MSIIGKSISTLSGESQIVVTAPTGSTVTCTTPNGLILIGVEVSGTWTFKGLTEFGSYVVKSILESNERTSTVLIDAIGNYTVTIVYITYLYNEGDKCESITGGYKSVKNYTTKAQYGGLYTNNAIDFSNFSTLHVELLMGTLAGGGSSTTGSCSSVSSSTRVYSNYITTTHGSGTAGTVVNIDTDVSTWSSGNLAHTVLATTSYSPTWTVAEVTIDNVIYYQIKLYINGKYWYHNIRKIWLT